MRIPEQQNVPPMPPVKPTKKSRMIDADELIKSIEKAFCKPCEARGDDYHGIYCRACRYGDLIDFIEDYATMKESENEND